MKDVGLLVMHYGTPASMAEVEAYYTHIRRGREPSAAQLADLVRRYEAIGGPSPLAEVSRRQAESIAEGMRAEGVATRLYVGAKHAPPFVFDAVSAMAGDGIEEAVGIVLAPHFSSMSIASYLAAARKARDEVCPSLRMEFVERWGNIPQFIDTLARNVLNAAAGCDLGETCVVFTAHSLPISRPADKYELELLETSELVAKAAGIPRWRFAFQSASATGEPWMGPDVLDVIEEEAGSCETILACTVGFVSSHLEVLYDLGIEARERCRELGVEFRLAETVGLAPGVFSELGRMCAQAVSGTVRQ